MDSARAIALTAVLLAASVPLGAALLRFFRFRPADFGDHLELAAVALSAGLGVHGLILTLLGLAHVLYPAAVIAVPLTLGALTVPLALPLWRWPRGPAIDGACEAVACPRPSNSARVLRPATIAALAVVAIAILIQDLAPPTDYDGLLYHLVAPRAFLAAHAITYLRHNFSADLPAFGEMLYAFGLAASSERMPQLLHGATGVLCVLLTYCLGRITVGRRAAFWGSAALAATPLMPFLATRAYIDLFTLLFSLVALLAFVHWLTDRATRWLLLAGCGTGLALATKYAAATLVLVLGAAILVAAWRRVNCRSLFARLAAAAAPPIAFGAAAAAVALPWYARQTLALGNPVWPMYAGGRDWDAARVEQLTYFISQYGTGHGLADWLLLPLHLYRDSWRFGHIPDSYPPLLAPLAPLALLSVRTPAVWLGSVTAGLVLLWARGWQDLRFLLPAYPPLALLGAAGVLRAGTRIGRPRAAQLALGVVVFLVAVWAAVREVPHAADTLAVVSGSEARDAYLERKLPDQRAIELLNEQAAPGASALFLGDGQIWYCRLRCLPDAAHDNLLIWFVRPGSPEASLAALRQEGVSHILLSKRDYWYLEHQDPERRLQAHLAVFYTFKARYLDLIYEDDLTELYRGHW